jgi:hypothetical protein
MANGQRPVSAGDFSGKQRADASHDALQEQRDNAARTTLASAIEEDEKRDGVFSPHTQERLDVPAAAIVEEEDLPGDVFYRSQEPQELVLTGYETEEQMVPLLAQRDEPQIPRSVVRSPQVKIRVNQDIEDMTYGFTAQGAPNNMTFREGFIYEVDINIADHLNQRGLVAQWVG